MSDRCSVCNRNWAACECEFPAHLIGTATCGRCGIEVGPAVTVGALVRLADDHDATCKSKVGAV